MQTVYGLIGYPLEHSFSELFFTEKFRREGIPDVTYENFPLEDITDIRALVARHHLAGFNVTIPHKIVILPYLDALSPVATAVGSVNTVKVSYKDGKLHLKGYNTDAPAFLQTLHQLKIPAAARALVLGNGGASRAVQYALREAQIEFDVVSRSAGETRLHYYDLTESLVSAHQLIINTTPIGMAPQVDACPDFPYIALSPAHTVCDLIYNPPKTMFLVNAEHYGARIKNGLDMLHTQANLAWTIWQAGGE